MPWKLYGELRGLYAPPRRNFAPAAADLLRARQNLLAATPPSTGPAITTTSSPPTTTPFANVIVVPSGRKLRPASLYGDEMRYASCTPASTLNSTTSKCAGVPDAGQNRLRASPVVRWTLNPSSTMRSITSWICCSVASSCIATIIVSVHFFEFVTDIC